MAAIRLTRRGVLRLLGVGALLGLGAVLLAGWLSGWFARDFRADDPLAVTPAPSPNWALAAPPGVATKAAPTMPAPIVDAEPSALLAAFTQAALAAPRVRRIDDGADPLRRAFVQRSRVFRFPDVVSVRALALADGRASLAVYSRSVVGSDDFGANRARLERWLAETARRF